MRRRQALKILGDTLDCRYGGLTRSRRTWQRALARFGVVSLSLGDRGRVMGREPDGTLRDLVGGFEVRPVECCGIWRLVGYPGNGACPRCQKVRFFVPREKDLRGEVEVFRFEARTTSRVAVGGAPLSRQPRRPRRSRGGEQRT